MKKHNSHTGPKRSGSIITKKCRHQIHSLQWNEEDAHILHASVKGCFASLIAEGIYSISSFIATRAIMRTY
ncbi:hypothetical protein NSU08_11065 [Paenibacillus sp. FSL H7-0331]|uniref:hypothetical protein n=1 Tax=Paenibacillus sp. FSL H7-0331 TaxID=1920421 RepID=UPI0030F89C03